MISQNNTTRLQKVLTSTGANAALPDHQLHMTIWHQWSTVHSTSILVVVVVVRVNTYFNAKIPDYKTVECK